MNWTRGVLYLCVVVLLYWWGVRVLLTVPSRHGGDRELDARWLQEQEARRQKKGARKQRLARRDVLVYLALTFVLLGALAWVVWGFVRG